MRRRAWRSSGFSATVWRSWIPGNREPGRHTRSRRTIAAIHTPPWQRLALARAASSIARAFASTSGSTSDNYRPERRLLNAHATTRIRQLGRDRVADRNMRTLAALAVRPRLPRRCTGGLRLNPMQVQLPATRDTPLRTRPRRRTVRPRALRSREGCDPTAIATLRTELDARTGLGPLWAGGRALFRTAAPIADRRRLERAGRRPRSRPRRSAATDLVIAVGAVPTGLHPYKLVDGDTWSLDPQNPAFAYDDFAGNADGRNSVLDTPDSGLGHLVELDRKRARPRSATVATSPRICRRRTTRPRTARARIPCCSCTTARTCGTTTTAASATPAGRSTSRSIARSPQARSRRSS